MKVTPIVTPETLRSLERTGSALVAHRKTIELIAAYFPPESFMALRCIEVRSEPAPQPPSPPPIPFRRAA